MDKKKLFRLHLETIFNQWTEDHWLEKIEDAQALVDDFNKFLRPGETMRVLNKVEEVDMEASK